MRYRYRFLLVLASLVTQSIFAVMSAAQALAPPPKVIHVQPAVGGRQTEFSLRWYSFGACGTCEGEQLYVYGPRGTRCAGDSRQHPFLQFPAGVGGGDPSEVRTYIGPHFGVGQLPRRHRTWCPGRYRGEITTDEPQTIQPSPYPEYVFSFRVHGTRRQRVNRKRELAGVIRQQI